MAIGGFNHATTMGQPAPTWSDSRGRAVVEHRPASGRSWPQPAWLDPGWQATQPLISSLPGSATHQLGVEMYARHHDGGTGRCVACAGPMPCRAYRHAAWVIRAAGEDPRCYDPGVLADHPAPQTPPLAHRRRPDQAYETPPAPPGGGEGYPVGGLGRRADVPYVPYER
jgi:hypothetical protein